jgi:hypothetical protein
MVVVQMGEKHKVRRALLQQFRDVVAAMPLQEKDAIPQQRVSEDADAPHVYQDSCMTDIVDLGQSTLFFLAV